MGRGERRALVLGGSGLVGYQVARKLAGTGTASAVVVSALGRSETWDAVDRLRREYPGVEITGFSGNLFLPGEPFVVDSAGKEPPLPRRQDPHLRRRVFDDLYNDFDAAYESSMLGLLVARVRPDVVVDCVNTATGISYQDVFTASQSVRADLDRETPDPEALRNDIENLLVSMSIPQLILHSRILIKALTEAGTGLYLKIGTTGTGGMGLNIPYTHGEERPSPQLLNKTAMAFAQTGMLFLMGRTPGGPIIKEVKPAALIGYRGIEFREATGRQFVKTARGEFELGPADEPYPLYRPKRVPLAGSLDLTPDPDAYERMRGPGGVTTVTVPLVDTGENGLFTRGEFEAITALDQMEYITPEEIADIVIMEVRGASTGTDVISAVDSAVLGSTYKAGLLRSGGLKILRELEAEHGVPSVALGRLGPPDLAKHLFEAHLLERVYGTVDAVIAKQDDPDAPRRMSERLFAELEANPLLGSLAVSIGIPIVCPDGETLLRGPLIKAPAYRKFRPSVDLDGDAVDRHAATWVDLRPARMAWWLATFTRLGASRHQRREMGWATARVGRETYLTDDIRIGSVVAWIFSNQGKAFRVL